MKLYDFLCSCLCFATMLTVVIYVGEQINNPFFNIISGWSVGYASVVLYLSGIDKHK